MVVKYFGVSLAVLFVCFSLSNALNASELTQQAQNDEITELPGLKFKQKFRQFSGYLNGVTNDKQLFYWFVESQDRPQIDPLIIWLSGGPGCSSLAQVVQGNGPYRLGKNKYLYENNYSWNKKANVLYIEAPVNTGYSYDKNGKYQNNDDNTADNNLAVLQQFLKVYPKYSDHEIYIAGDDYGGIFVPMLAKKIIKNRIVNLKGIAIGNGLSNRQLNVMSLIYYMHNHGLLSDNLWGNMMKACCRNTPFYHCDFAASKSMMCQYFISVVSVYYAAGIDNENLYGPCETRTQERRDISDSDLLAMTKLKSAEETKINTVNASAQSSIYCQDDSNMVNFFNAKNVKNALHVRSQSPKWKQCNYGNYRQQTSDISPTYQYLLDNKVRILVYNGDVDMTNNYMGQEWFVDLLKLRLKYKYNPWYYTDENNWKQIAGFRKIFYKGKVPLTYATVRGAGKLVPKDKPRAALRMITRFITNKKL